MRILAKASGIKYSPIVVLVLALAVLSVIGERALLRGARGARGAATVATNVADTLRLQVEPAIFIGGLVVSRNRHIIAGAAMGCATGAATGAGAAALAGVLTGGLGWAAIPPAAGIGCLVGAGAGVAVAYPLDSWALAME
ncbi:MAG: hypothetical protein ACLQJR_20600 [Stellaceae bacterium]